MENKIQSKMGNVVKTDEFSIVDGSEKDQKAKFNCLHDGAYYHPLAEKIKSMKDQDIRLLCGELTAQEMRTAKAILNWVVRNLEGQNQTVC